MKKKFLLIPMLAGVMLAASCSKDDGTTVADEIVVPNETPEAVVEQPAAQKTYPFSIQASKEAPISKIALENGRDLTFDGSETLLLEYAKDKYVELNYVSGAGTTTAIFKKDLSDAEKSLIEGKNLWGVIKGSESSLNEVQSSTTSLADAVNRFCYLKSTKTITYDGQASASLTLADEKAYIAFDVADGQLQVSLKKVDASDYSWYPLGKDNDNKVIDKIWFAVPGGETYATRLKKTPLSAAKSSVYTLEANDDVDLDPEFNILWAICNLGADSPEKYGNYYAWGETTGYPYGTDHKFSPDSYTASGISGDLSGNNDAAYVESKGKYRMPTKEELSSLANIGVWKAKNAADNPYSDVAGFLVDNEYGTIFLPAAGDYDNGPYGWGFANESYWGFYWSSSGREDKSFASILQFSSEEDAIGIRGYYRYFGMPIRPVRSMN